MVFVIGILAIIIIGIIGFRSYITHNTDTTVIGFENIGELATQSAYCTEVNCTNDVKKLFKIKLPFTQSKYIYSYDVVIKAGFDFNKIKWKEKDKTIEVTLPKAQILSCEVDTDSLQVYHEKESIFNQISLEDNNEALKKLRDTAKKNALENGILENAYNNAKVILKGFFENKYDLQEYELKFKS